MELSILYQSAPLADDAILAEGVPRNATLQIVLGAPSQTSSSDTNDMQLVDELVMTVTVRLPNGACFCCSNAVTPKDIVLSSFERA